MKHFTISELLYSQKAVERRIWNGADAEQEANLTALVSHVLDPLREQYGYPIHVSSGFRCNRLNSSLPGSSKDSQHRKGEAADIYTDAGLRGNYLIGRLVVLLGSFDQLIFEDVLPDNLLPQWIHVSWKRQGNNRCEIRKHIKGTGPIYPVVSRKELGL
ncbi:MAG: D-Ala-D-Ala carboxypeptidase family metallohydrolase [Bacteroidales bacterium]|nr:D-Ala-D-Ala carboxypeptidase family metallohydrolase [Bacteroidales bacterium]